MTTKTSMQSYQTWFYFQSAEADAAPEPQSKPPFGGGAPSHMDELQKILARRKGNQDTSVSVSLRHIFND